MDNLVALLLYMYIYIYVYMLLLLLPKRETGEVLGGHWRCFGLDVFAKVARARGQHGSSSLRMDRWFSIHLVKSEGSWSPLPTKTSVRRIYSPRLSPP